MTTKDSTFVRAGLRVNTEYVDQMRAEYKTARWQQNSERLGKPDAMSVWYDLQTIEEFVAACKEAGADGVRFYFTAYPENYTEVPAHAGLQSMVSVATRSRLDAKGNLTNKDLYIRQNDELTVLAFNNGMLCPPACNKFGDNDLGLAIIDKGEKGFEII